MKLLKIVGLLESKHQSEEDIEEVASVLKRYDQVLREKLSGFSKATLRKLVSMLSCQFVPKD